MHAFRLLKNDKILDKIGAGQNRIRNRIEVTAEGERRCATGEVLSGSKRPARPRGEKQTKLNPRQKRFVTEYLKDGNGTQAAIRAGYATSSAAMHACRLLKNGRISDEVRAGQKRRLNHIEVTAERIWRELADVAFFDPARLFDGEGNPLPLDKMPEDARRALTRVDVKELVEGDRLVGTVTRLKFAGRLAALKALGKCLGMFSKSLKGSKQPPPV